MTHCSSSSDRHPRSLSRIWDSRSSAPQTGPVEGTVRDLLFGLPRESDARLSIRTGADEVMLLSHSILLLRLWVLPVRRTLTHRDLLTLLLGTARSVMERGEKSIAPEIHPSRTYCLRACHRCPLCTHAPPGACWLNICHRHNCHRVTRAPSVLNHPSELLRSAFLTQPSRLASHPAVLLPSPSPSPPTLCK